MFRENQKHLQKDFFSLEYQLNPAKQLRLRESKEAFFYELIFCKIKEQDFAVLYSKEGSRPNTPINQLVSSLIFKNYKNWSYRELFDHIDFDLLTRTALGLSNYDETPFCQATIFNFQNLLNDYYINEGINLLEVVFDGLTEEQLKTLKIKTNIQRTDSFLVASNIRNYNRLQLLVEVIIRLNRVLSEEDKKLYEEKLRSYIKQSAGHYVHEVKEGDYEVELRKIGEVYQWLYDNMRESYKNTEIFKTFERVYTEHFTKVEDKVELKPNEELTSDIVQSPDDLDATYRKKRGKKSHGYSINATETANPDNELNLITDIAVESNNKDDSKILNDRLDVIKEKTPDLDEMHTDGAYGSESNDKKMEELEIKHIQTAIKGSQDNLEVEIDEKLDGEYEVSCQCQRVKAVKGKKKYQAHFDQEKCRDCAFSDQCKLRKTKNKRVYSFNREDYLKKKRHKNIKSIPKERRKIRPNVEATVREFKRSTDSGKLKVRGKYKTMIFAFTMAIGINLGRIYRFTSEKQ